MRSLGELIINIKSKNMKSLMAFYLKALIPLPALYIPAEMGIDWLFVAYLLLYLFVFRTILDGNRLVEKGVISKAERWKLIIPFWRYQYFEELYFR